MDNNKLIVLDIDETLFHCEYELEDFDYVFEEDNIMYYTKKRPYLEEFLNYIKGNFKYGIYTTAGEDYTKIHMKKLNLDPLFLLSYKNCTQKRKFSMGEQNGYTSEWYSLKKLDKVKRYSDKSNMIAIDDKWESFANDYGNLIKVNPFTGDINDTTLKKLMKYLEDLKGVKNIRKVEKRGWMSKY